MLDWITGFIESAGPLGVALLMFAENVFPPIPSEVVMPLAGAAAARGAMSPWMAALAGTVGSLAGAWVWYEVALRVGDRRLRRFAERHGRWIGISAQDVDRSDAWFDRHGAKAVLLGRLVPAVRTLISVPAGLHEMPRGRFLAMTTLGSAAWTGLLVVAGVQLGERWEQVHRWLAPVSNGVAVLIVGLWLWRVITWKRRAAG